MIRLALAPDKDLPSQLTAALRGRAIDLAPETEDQPHLYTGLATCWRGATEAAGVALSELRKLQASAPDADFDPAVATRTLKALIYAATEVFDLYHQAVPRLLERRRIKAELRTIRDYQAGVKRLRDPIALMCNRMKHNFREIVAARIVSQKTGAKTFVYRINVAQGGVQRADAEIHRDASFFSIERTLHEIIHGLLRADHNAAGLVRHLADNYDQPNELGGTTRLRLAATLADLANRVPIVAASEPARFNGVMIEDDELVLTRVAVEKVPEPTIRTMHMTVDEAARSAQVIL